MGMRLSWTLSCPARSINAHKPLLLNVASPSLSRTGLWREGSESSSLFLLVVSLWRPSPCVFELEQHCETARLAQLGPVYAASIERKSDSASSRYSCSLGFKVLLCCTLRL